MPRLSRGRISTKVISGSLCLCSIGAIAVALRNWALQEPAGALQRITANVESNEPTFVRSIRPAYPYAVISGGVYSSCELRESTVRDPIIASHYAGFDIDHAKLVRTTVPTLRYVSYRRNNQVMWTKKALRIPKGELLLSDGVRFARARCGNRLSSTPVGPAPDGEPDVELSIPDNQAPRSKSLIAASEVAPVEAWPLSEIRIDQPSIDSLHPISENIYSRLTSEGELTYANPILRTPTIIGSGWTLPAAPAPLNPLIPVWPPSEPTAPVPEPPTRWQAAVALAIGLVVAVGIRRANPKTDSSRIRGRR